MAGNLQKTGICGLGKSGSLMSGRIPRTRKKPGKAQETGISGFNDLGQQPKKRKHKACEDFGVGENRRRIQAEKNTESA